MVDCHIHMVLDGKDWRAALARHSAAPDRNQIRLTLETYQRRGFTYLRDGGDRWGTGKLARELAPEYGIRYRTPLAPLCRKGHYGGFIGRSYDSMKEYAQAVRQARNAGADFIKIMISGLMDFNRFGVLSEAGLPAEDIRELIHIAHEEGFAVMAHGNGPRVMEAAALAGVDSLEHGAYADPDALAAMAENRVIWVPTLSTVGNLLGTGRYDDRAVQEILGDTCRNLRLFSGLGGLIAPGSDAGAWAVPHGTQTEYTLLEQALGPDAPNILQCGIAELMRRF